MLKFHARIGVSLSLALIAACDTSGTDDDDSTVVDDDDTVADDDDTVADDDDTSVADDDDSTVADDDDSTVADDDDTVQPLPPPVLTTTTYTTIDQMLLANEINESGEPFAEALGYNLDELDPAVPGVPDNTAYVLGIENYEYSRYQLGTVTSQSGIGLHMMWAPVIGNMAAMEPEGFDGSMTAAANGYNEDDELMKNIMMFSTLANHAPPGNAWPEYAEFASGDPHLPQAVDAANFGWDDFSTLRWDRSSFDMTLNPGTLGQTMMKQYLWAQDMLSGFHNAADDAIDADGVVSPDLADSPDFDPNNDVFYGGDSLDGFIGMVLTAEAINKAAFLTGALAYDGAALGSIDLMSYDPANGIQYFPHAIAVTESPVATGLPPQATGFSVTDSSSDLFDQASLLWGLSSFVNMMDPSDSSDAAHLAYKEVFDGSPFPADMAATGTPGPYDLMKGTAKVTFLNLLALHQDDANQVLRDSADYDGTTVTQGTEVSALASAYTIVALEQFIEEFASTPLEAMAQDLVTEQASFLIDAMSDGSGHYYEQVTVGNAPTGDSTLLAQSAAVRGLYVAARVTGDADILLAADEAAGVLVDDFWVPEAKVFRSTMATSVTTATYDARNFAVAAGALREATLADGVSNGAAIYTDLFMTVADTMQLAEGGNTGETGSDSDGDGVPFIPEQPDGLPAVFATEGVYSLPTP